MKIHSIALALALCLLGCSTGDGEKPELDGAVQDLGAKLDKQVKPDVSPLTAYKVAAIQYGSGNHSKVAGCSNDLCGLTYYIRKAAKSKALLVVIPEYSTGQGDIEASPKIGDKPGTDTKWAKGSIVKTFAQLADELEITLVFNLITKDDGGKRYNTNVAVDRDGKVVARHYKFELFGGENYTPGPSINTSFFDTPAGRAGILICADIQCAITGLVVYPPTCTQHAKDRLQEFFAKKPDLVVFSAAWTVGDSNPPWSAVTVQSKVAKGGQVWFVGANTTKGQGYGGGIFKPDGQAVAIWKKAGTPGIALYDLPLKKK